MDEPDRATIEAALAGDEGAFVALVRPLERPVWRFLVRMVGDESLASDLAQDTFVRVYLNLGRFRHRSKFSTWVFQIARNAAIDAIRSRDRRRRIDWRFRLRDEASAPDASADVEVVEALGHLSPKLREAVVLIDVLGLRYAEAAEVLGIPVGTVKSRVAAARESLCRWVEDADAV